jgi:hypothetical protein
LLLYIAAKLLIIVVVQQRRTLGLLLEHLPFTDVRQHHNSHFTHLAPKKQPMLIDQAALTGESLPVKRFAGQCAFSGSAVKQGERNCLVYATGGNTFFGKAAGLIDATDQVGHLQKV